MTETVVRFDDVSLRYRLARQRTGSFKEYAIHWLRGSLTYETFWALRHLSFSVARGEAVGILGCNGAGKSTLLRLISGVLSPTAGRVEVRGRVTPVLELGAGFEGELTGRENVFLYGLYLGRKRMEIAAALDRIAAFAELGNFLDSPVHTYSSGMLARLAYAVATAWVPEILLIDEALAVGDSGFAARCLERQAEFLRQGTTLLLVSHDPETLRATTRRTLLLDQGRLVADGPTELVLERYLLPGSGEENPPSAGNPRPGGREWETGRARATREGGGQ